MIVTDGSCHKTKFFVFSEYNFKTDKLFFLLTNKTTYPCVLEIQRETLEETIKNC